jgi:hypothetical protein
MGWKTAAYGVGDWVKVIGVKTWLRAAVWMFLHPR